MFHGTLKYCLTMKTRFYKHTSTSSSWLDVISWVKRNSLYLVTPRLILYALSIELAEGSRNIEWIAYPAIRSISEMIHNTHWYILNLCSTAEEEFVREVYLWLTHPNCGRMRNTNPRRNPETNPPIWAKLSTWGRIPTAKLITMMTNRVTRAATWRGNETRKCNQDKCQDSSENSNTNAVWRVPY